MAQFSVDATLYLRTDQPLPLTVADFQFNPSLIVLRNPEANEETLSGENPHLDLIVQIVADDEKQAETRIQQQLPSLVKSPSHLLVDHVTIIGTYNDDTKEWVTEY